jgi:putative ABC transport system substrate-binding protein
MIEDFGAKRLQMLKEVIPRLSRVTVLGNFANPDAAQILRETAAAGRPLEVQVESIGVRSPADLENAFQVAIRQRPDALITSVDPLTYSHRKQISDFLLKSRLPSAHGLREYADAGGLIAYGPNLANLRQHAARYVDKILKGAKPLPVEQPTKFELIINLKTAKALGLTIPPALLARADEVIE